MGPPGWWKRRLVPDPPGLPLRAGLQGPVRAVRLNKRLRAAVLRFGGPRAGAPRSAVRASLGKAIGGHRRARGVACSGPGPPPAGQPTASGTAMNAAHATCPNSPAGPDPLGPAAKALAPAPPDSCCRWPQRRVLLPASRQAEAMCYSESCLSAVF